jgi:hypothetical protein
MATGETNAQDQADALGLKPEDYSLLVPGGRTYFTNAVKQYADSLLSQAVAIEENEHTGSGPAEITAAHVEEAKWVLIRRQRRHAQRRGWVAFVRVVQALMAAGTGIGASSLSEPWGVFLCIAGVLFGSVALIVERELDRDL